MLGVSFLRSPTRICIQNAKLLLELGLGNALYGVGGESIKVYGGKRRGFSSASSPPSSGSNGSDLAWKNNKTVPNMITMTRMACSPLLGAAIYMDYKAVALGGCLLASFSDWLDGYIAKNYNQKSILGGFIDPLADKIFIATLTASLTAKGLIPASLCSLIIGRDVVITLVSFYVRAVTKTKDANFFDVSGSAVTVTPSVLSKANTGLQMLLVSGTLLGDCLSLPALLQMEPLWYTTAVTTTASGLGYLDGSGMKFNKKQGEEEG